MDPLATFSVVISVGALAIAYRSDRRSARAFGLAETEHAQRQFDRAARPGLCLDVRPSNRIPDAEGVITSPVTRLYVTLAITVGNVGTRSAGRTEVEVWLPTVVADTTLKWLDPSSGREDDRFGYGMPDPNVTLDTGNGRPFDAQRMARTLDVVTSIGETLHLRVPCPVTVGGTSTIPVRVRARTEGSEAETRYCIRLRHATA